MAEKKPMSSFLLDAPFDPKDLVRDLPELLAGPEPVLDHPIARRMLVSDPTCRAGIQAVAEMLLAVRGGSEAVSSLRRTRPPRVPRSVEVARKYLKEELYGVLLRWIAPIRLASVAESSKVGPGFSMDFDPEHLKRMTRQLERARSRGGLGSAYQTSIAHIHDAFTDSAFDDAARAITAGGTLFPNRSLTELNRLILQYRSNRGASVGAWLGLAKSADDSEVVGHALTWAAVTASDHGDPRLALDLDCAIVERYESKWVAYYNGCYHAAEARRFHDLARFSALLASRVDASLAPDDIQRPLRDQFLRDADFWRQQMRTQYESIELIWKAATGEAVGDFP